jgi:hypothetical protein
MYAHTFMYAFIHIYLKNRGVHITVHGPKDLNLNTYMYVVLHYLKNRPVHVAVYTCTKKSK